MRKPRQAHYLSVIGILMLNLFASVATADVLLIEHVQRNAEFPKPAFGQTMAQVENAFGEPMVRYDPVGDPPITRWVYEAFIVYFEDRFVIDSPVRFQRDHPEEEARDDEQS